MTFSRCKFRLARRGFTLTEVVVAVAILGLLAALLFPVFGKARESSRQGSCAGKLQNIYLATRQYREDFQGNPPNLETLLPAGSRVVITSGGHDPLSIIGGGGDSLIDPLTKQGGAAGIAAVNKNSPGNSTSTIVFTPNTTAYLKSLDDALCPSDTMQLNGFTASYGAKIGSVWNFYGYDRLGFSTDTTPEAQRLVNPALPYDAHLNPVRYSLANRFAPPSTIVTHCIFHRMASSRLQNPYALGTANDQGAGAGASDIILRLDGSAKKIDVSNFTGTKSDGSDSAWLTQTF